MRAWHEPYSAAASARPGLLLTTRSTWTWTGRAGRQACLVMVMGLPKAGHACICGVHICAECGTSATPHAGVHTSHGVHLRLHTPCQDSPARPLAGWPWPHCITAAVPACLCPACHVPAGTALVRSEEELRFVRETGPTRVLAQAGIPWSPAQL